MSQSVAKLAKAAARARTSKYAAKAAAAAAQEAREAAERAGAPSEVTSIPTRSSESLEHSSAAIRPMGNSRRVFLLDPHMSATELHGLAHRLRVLVDNPALNSVLIATDDRDDVEDNCLPSYIAALDDTNLDPIQFDEGPGQGQQWHVSGGYDPVALYESGDHKDVAKLEYLLDGVRNLAMAVSGKGQETKIPVITLPHGMVSDAGYALCMGSFVLASEQTSFCIRNPSRGLTLDPIGMSYILPRLGAEFNQASKDLRGCGMLLALTGFEANADDMIETGLATHQVLNIGALGLLEQNLATAASWEGQSLVKQPKYYYGQMPAPDANARFRNILISRIVNLVSERDINKNNEIPIDPSALKTSDPAFDLDDMPWETAFSSSDLVTYAETFDKIFRVGKSLEGLLSGFKEVASRKSDDPDELEGIRVAQDIVRRLRKQSPLALRVTHQLMLSGSGSSATFEKCVAREKRAQLKLLQRPDFQNWAKFAAKNKTNPEAVRNFTGWQHKSIEDVTADEVEEIIAAS